MTIRFLKPWNGYQPDQVATLAGGVETTLINGGIAVANTAQGSDQIIKFSTASGTVTDSAARAAISEAAGGGAVFVPAGLTYGHYMDAVARLQATGKPGVIQFAPDAYDFSADGQGLLLVNGVSHEGWSPKTTPTTGAPDIGAVLNGGTVIIGDGTFPGMSQGLIDTALPPNNQSGAISGGFVRGIGFKNFTNAVRTGSNPVNYGTFNFLFENLYAFDCTQESFVFNNFQHTRFQKLYDSNCAHGPLWTGNGGNSSIADIFSSAPTGQKFSRGIRIVSPETTGWLNFIVAEYLQRNAFNRTVATMSAQFTSGNSAIRVANGESLVVGAPVMFSAAVGNVGLDRTWVVRSIAFVSGTTGPADITIAIDTYRTAVVTPNASATVNLSFWGMPHFEIIKGPNGTLTSPGGTSYTGINQSNIIVRGIDLEGIATSAISFEHATADVSGVELAFGIGATTPALQLVDSTVSYGGAEMSCAIDSLSRLKLATGTAVKKIFSMAPEGLYSDTSSGNVQSLALGRDARDTPHLQMKYGGGKWHAYASRSIGQLTTYNTTANQLGYQLAFGDNHYQGTGAGTWVFPDAPGNDDNRGAECNIYNDSGTHNLVISVNAGQNPLSNVTGRTQVTLTPGQYIKTKFAWKSGQPLGYLSVLSTNGTFNA